MNNLQQLIQKILNGNKTRVNNFVNYSSIIIFPTGEFIVGPLDSQDTMDEFIWFIKEAYMEQYPESELTQAFERNPDLGVLGTDDREFMKLCTSIINDMNCMIVDVGHYSGCIQLSRHINNNQLNTLKQYLLSQRGRGRIALKEINGKFFFDQLIETEEDINTLIDNIKRWSLAPTAFKLINGEFI